MRSQARTVDDADTGLSARGLQRIADALHLPVEAFFADAAIPLAVAQREELLSLWSALDRPADRQRALQMLRALAAGASDA